ncbi:MAG: ABC transporter permease [Lachnospiraceae bacterium]|nr:ABC transporter permease [Lachnospiraceae bacterium]
MKNENLSRFLKLHRSECTMLLVFIAFYIIMSFASPVFSTSKNVLNVLSQMTVVAILAIGQTFVIVSGGIDLSVGMVVCISGMLGGMYMSKTGNLLVGILIVLGVALLVGMINGFLVGYMKIAAFIATLGTQSICSSLAYVTSNGNSAAGFPRMLSEVGNYRIFNIRMYVYFLIILYIVMIWVMARTKVGRFTYAIGSNKDAARLSGINVSLYTMLCYMISGLMCGLATLVNMIRLMSVDPTTGTGLEMDAIAGAVIGGVSMAGGRGSLVGTFIGVLLYTFLRNALNLLGINPFWQGTVTGIVIIFAVLAESLTNRKNR